MDDTLSQKDLTPPLKKTLDERAGECEAVLKDLEKTLDKYQEIDPQTTKGITGKSRRIWKKAKWDEKSIDGYRQRITLNISAFNMFLEQITLGVSINTKAGVDRLHERQDDEERKQEFQETLTWLSPNDYTAQHNDFSSRRCEGTGDWLLNSTEFQNWSNQEAQILFCWGIPGAGKTILSAAVIDHLFASIRGGDVGVAYLYFNFRRQYEQSPLDVLSSLLRQLLAKKPVLPEMVIKLYGTHSRNRTRPSFKEVSEALQSTIQEFSRAFVVIDALDETHVDRKKMLTELFDIQAKTKLNLFATSRSIPDIEIEFRQNQKSTALEILAQEQDIRRYLESCIPSLPGFVARNSALQEEIKAAIVKTVNGM